MSGEAETSGESRASASSAPSSLAEWLEDRWAPFLVLIVLGSVAYFRSLFFGFTNHDDHVLILFNQPYLTDPSNLGSVLWQDGFAYMGEGSQGLYYRPMLWVSLILDAQLAGRSAGPYHAQNLLLHLAASCLAFRLLTRLDVARGAALFFAAVFCVHPALASSVAWIPGRNDTLLAFFLLLCVHAVLDYLRRPGPLAGGLALLFFALALFTKEGAVALCAVVPAMVYLRREQGRPSLVQLGVLAAASAVVLFVWIGMRNDALGQFPLFVSKVPSNIGMFAVYIGKTLFPFGLAVVPSVNAPQVVAGVLALGLFGLAAWLSRDRIVGNVGLGLLWFFAFLFPALLAPTSTRGLEHRLYVPLIGLALFAASLRVPEKWRPAPRWTLPAASALLLVFLVLGQLRLAVFANPVNYWEDALTTTYDRGTAIENVGIAYYEAGRLDDAERAAREALEFRPKNPHVQLLMGIILKAQSRDTEAARALGQAVALKPDLLPAWEALAEVQERLRDTEGAAESRGRIMQLKVGGR